MLLKDKKPRLGRGLGALIPDFDEDKAQVSELQYLAIEKIVPNPSQPRVIFDEEKMKELADSIKCNGINQPILVRKIDNAKYEIVAGERRWRACLMLKMEIIPAIVRELTDEESLQIALIENIQREDIGPIEEARAYQQLIKRFSYTQDELAQKIGKSRPAITNAIRLLDLPDEIIEHVISGTISAGHARTLLSLSVNEDRINALHKIINDKLSVRQAEDLVRRSMEIGKVPTPAKQAYVFEKESYIKENIWKKFTFKGNQKTGKFVFSYSSPEEKQELLNSLGIQ
ncbi:MAG TPA: hypothetical protein DF296_10380 [Candidatus Margulisbacteria bacterium]|nr:hypothetical protein [Candidatus Margulisiibacteriota bacterium]HCT85591.1 hypothetical protein [Candidatus Margulisiibacteriota bacterium]